MLCNAIQNALMPKCCISCLTIKKNLCNRTHLPVQYSGRWGGGEGGGTVYQCVRINVRKLEPRQVTWGPSPVRQSSRPQRHRCDWWRRCSGSQQRSWLWSVQSLRRLFHGSPQRLWQRRSEKKSRRSLQVGEPGLQHGFHKNWRGWYYDSFLVVIRRQFWEFGDGPADGDSTAGGGKIHTRYLQTCVSLYCILFS